MLRKPVCEAWSSERKVPKRGGLPPEKTGFFGGLDMVGSLGWILKRHKTQQKNRSQMP